MSARKNKNNTTPDKPPLVCCLFVVTVMLLIFQSTTLLANTLRTFNHDDKLTPFTLPAIDSGKAITFSPEKGKPSAIMFFSINPDFRKQRSLALLSELSAIAEQFKNRADIIAVFSDDKDKQTVVDFIKERSIKVQVLFDKNKDVYNQYGVFMMPLVILSSAKGTLHEVVPYTYNIRELVDGNLKLLLGDWDMKQFQESMNPKENIKHTKEEKEYIRRINYGRVMSDRKMYSQAVREFSTATKLMPDQPEAYVELGFAQLAMKDLKEAEASFREALKRNPDSDDGIAGLGLALYRQGKTNDALTQLENALIAPKPKLDVIIALADIYEQKGEITKAIRLHKLAVSRLMTLYEHKWKEQ